MKILRAKPPGWQSASADIADVASKVMDLARETGDETSTAVALILSAVSVAYWEVDRAALREPLAWARRRLRGNSLAKMLALPVGDERDPHAASKGAAFRRLVDVIELRDRSEVNSDRCLDEREMRQRIGAVIALAWKGRPGLSLPSRLPAAKQSKWIEENVTELLPADLVKRIMRGDPSEDVAEYVLTAKDEGARISRLGFLARDLDGFDKAETRRVRRRK